MLTSFSTVTIFIIIQYWSYFLCLVFKELEPEYQLTEDEIYGIFDFTDSNQVL